MAQARQLVRTSVEALLDLARREAVTPHVAEVETLKAALAQVRAEIAELRAVKDAQHDLACELRATIAAGLQRKPLLILP
ncbi:hypothetical protein [Rhodobacter sp. CZR27]|uniref:hypothetical protein n=1 Tax=Rhodobacter sp. CZR27 TaxID=2033869 RepID=UPI000BBEFAE2|nr:hypothetical protein [Rhodobacter sp. CZR27]